MTCLPEFHKVVYENSSNVHSLKKDDVFESGSSIIITRINNNISLKDPIYKEKWDLLGVGWVNKGSKFELQGKPSWWLPAFALRPTDKDEGDLIYTKDTQGEFGFYKIKSGEFLLEGIGNIAIIDQRTNCIGFHVREGNRVALIEQLKFGQTWINPEYLIDKNGSVFSASFVSNADEIVYVGDIDISIFSHWSPVHDKIKIEIRDNYDEAVRSFRKNYPKLKNREVVKRLIKLGAMLNKDGEVKFFNSRMSVIRKLK